MSDCERGGHVVRQQNTGSCARCGAGIDYGYSHLQRAHDLYRQAQGAILAGKDHEATQYEREAREAEGMARQGSRYRLWYSLGEKPPLICRACGSLVIDREEHDAWHTALQSAFTMLDRRT